MLRKESQNYYERVVDPARNTHFEQILQLPTAWREKLQSGIIQFELTNRGRFNRNWRLLLKLDAATKQVRLTVRTRPMLSTIAKEI